MQRFWITAHLTTTVDALRFAAGSVGAQETEFDLGATCVIDAALTNVIEAVSECLRRLPAAAVGTRFADPEVVVTVCFG